VVAETKLQRAAVFRPWRVLFGYAVAVLGTVGVFYGRLALGVEYSDRPLMIMYFLPVIISAYIGGWGPGLLSTAIAAFLTKYFLVPPLYSFAFEHELDFVQFLILIATGTAASFFTEALHRAKWRAEEAQRVQTQIIATSPGVIYAYDRHADGTGSIVYVSPAVERVFGVTAQQWTADREPLFSRMHPDDLPRMRAAIAEAGRNLTAWQGTYRIRHPTKGEIWIEGHSIPERDAAGNVRWLGIYQDVTEMKRLDDRLRQAQKAEAIGQLTGGVAHDFNNLLGIISGNLELLRDAVKERPELHELADGALTAVDRGAALTRGLLAFARQQPLDPKPIDINKLVTDLVPLLRRTLGETIRINFVGAEEPWQCEADDSQLQNAIINLAVNSRDAMPEGGELTIETANVSLDANYAEAHTELIPGDYVMLAVSDTGIGMAPETVAKAFEPFFTTKGLAGGSGLGLSMVYGFAKQSHGHVNIYSELGHGTTVKLYLPCIRNPQALGPELAPVAPARGHEKILVVEDDDAMRRLTCRLLTALDYTPVEAASGPDALIVLGNNPDVALVLSDVVLPGGMRGPQLAERVKAVRPDIKFVYMSGYTDNAIVHHGRLDPGAKLLQKPFRRSALGDIIRGVLDGKTG
jgi:PAS domain S-box-containing protein